MDDFTGDLPTIASTLSGAGGLVAGRYRVRARLGRGASKEVYLAYDDRLDREVALAIVVGAGSNAVARARVAREAQVTGRLGDHPNVITVYDTGEIDGVPYLVLRAMGGGSLAAALRRERPSIAETLRIGGQIAAALAHAHAHDVVHRDVKPDNVWLTADGTAALGDFGIAHVAGADRLTAEGVVVGTVRYLAPEQIRGEPVNAASDLYAFGITLYELVCGHPPFTADDPSSVLTQHLTVAPVAPSEHEPAIPPALDELILALLAKQPERRPASAAAVGAALAAITAGTGGGRPPAPARAPATPAPPATATQTRRLVAVLAVRADHRDPEVLHSVFDRCAAVVEEHGGTVERYLGDALVAFFGLTESYGDDALRGARAAVALRATRAELRLGLESGEVFVGAGARGTVVTGAAISASVRLAERAAAGEILLGDDLRAALAALADADVDPASGRLLELRAEPPALLRAAATPFVGRAGELAELHAALARARDDATCHLVTIAGPPGIGKSRLTGEFLGAIGDDVTVLTGRCLAYGEGTTYRALADIVRGLGDDPRRSVEELLAGDEQGVRAILGAIGVSDEPAQGDETAWALRRLLERLARDRPLVVAVEDIHWAEPVLLDMLDHLVALSSGSPILLLCLTRPELLQERPAWAAPQPNRSVLVLEALADADARELVEALGAGELAPRIAQRAEGNPLFLEQLAAVDTGQDTIELPASIQAVLTARIDRLEPAERTLLQRAAVAGRTFHAGQLALLLPEEERRGVASRLVALARKGLVGADRAEFAGEDAFRFTHALIREAAYASVPKLLRADLHARVAEWLESQPAAADEIVGYHLEQACGLAAELGRSGEPERTLAARAARRLEAASGRRSRAATRLRRARCSSGRWRWPATTTRLRGRCCPRSAPRCSRPAAWPTRRACSTRRSRRPGAERPRARRGGEPVRLPGGRDRDRHRRRCAAIADAALAVLDRAGDDRGRGTRLVAARAGSVGMDGHVGGGRGGVGARRATARRRRARSASCSSRWAGARRRRARPDAGRRGDPPLRGVPPAGRRQPDREACG